MKGAHLKSVNIVSGITRLYLGLWLLWAAFLAAESYEVVLIAFGSDYWSTQKIELREKELCERCENQTQGFFEKCKNTCEFQKYSRPIGPAFLPRDQEDARQLLLDLLRAALIFPALLGAVGIGVLCLARWVLAGFLK